MKSQLEKNQNNLKVNDVIFFYNGYDSDKWKVTGLFEGGFEAEDDYEKRYFLFSELEQNWHISESSMEYNRQNFRTVYV